MGDFDGGDPWSDPPAPRGARSRWGDDGTTPDFGFDPPSGPAFDGAAHTTGRAPLPVLAVAGAAVAGGIALAALVGRAPTALVAWALCGPVAIGALAVFSRLDAAQRTRPEYLSGSFTKPLYWAICVAAGGGVLFAAWLYANWWARR